MGLGILRNSIVENGNELVILLLLYYTVGQLVIRKVLKIRIWGVSLPAWAIGSYSSGPQAD